MVDIIMYYYGLCSYFPITIWDCMDIVDYLDYAGHVMLIVMFFVVALCSLDDQMFGLYNDVSVCTVDAPETRETLAIFSMNH